MIGAGSSRSGSRSQATIWIDLDNSPHVPFFAPIIKNLHQHGFSLLLTARNCFQVCELAELHNLAVCPVGRHYGKNLVLKLYGLGIRALQLAPVVKKMKPVLAVSHGSRSQLLLSQALGIPSVRICDYEFVKNPSFLRATWVLVPDVIPIDSVGRDRKRTRTYPGIKEDVYVPYFKNDRSIRSQLGLSDTDVVVTVRPPAAEAHYRSRKSEQLYRAAMKFLIDQSDARIVLLPRTDKQADQARVTWPEAFDKRKVIIPKRVVDGLNLIWNSDFVISGGGTMNREAAALHVPVYSIFGGEIGAVDQYLASEGRLVMLDSPHLIAEQIVVARRDRDAHVDAKPRAALETIVNFLVNAIPDRGSSNSRESAYPVASELGRRR